MSPKLKSIFCPKVDTEDRKCTRLHLFLPDIEGDYVIDEVLLDNLLEENELLTFHDITHKRIPIIKIINIDTKEIISLCFYLGFYNNEYLKDFFIENLQNAYREESDKDRLVYESSEVKPLVKDNSILTLCSFNFNSQGGILIDRLNGRANNREYLLKAEHYKQNHQELPVNDLRTDRNFNFTCLIENHNQYNYKPEINHEDPDYNYDDTSRYTNSNYRNIIPELSKIRKFNKIIDEITDIVESTLSNSKGFGDKKKHEAVKSFVDNYELLLDCLYIKGYYHKDDNYKKLKNYNFNDDVKNIDKEETDKYYVGLINNPTRYLEKIIDEYKEFLEEDSIKGVRPDIYMLCGTEEFPIYYEEAMTRDFRRQYKPKCEMLIKFSEYFYKFFKHSEAWYYINLLVCLSAQIVAPIYYIYDYRQNTDSFCPNNSGYDLKLFGVVFFLTLYSRYSDMQEQVFKSQYKFSQTHFIKHRRWLIFSFFVNQTVTFLIPLVTYVLFLDDPTILGFILNCVTATFLIDLDNIIATAGTGETLLEQFSNDCMYLEYISNGVVAKTFINKVYNSSFLSAITTIASMLQVGLMFFLTIQIGVCL